MKENSMQCSKLEQFCFLFLVINLKVAHYKTQNNMQNYNHTVIKWFKLCTTDGT